MAREIKFRGFTSNGGWVCGGYYKHDSYCEYITVNDFDHAVVVRESIGQHTGLKDRNGIDIYEGDAIRAHHDDGESNYAGIVEWIAEGDWLGWCLMDGGVPEMLRADDQDALGIIGNVYENPELTI
jgi:uncharacterized phage protein (TIGR01671 family)